MLISLVLLVEQPACVWPRVDAPRSTVLLSLRCRHAAPTGESQHLSGVGLPASASSLHGACCMCGQLISIRYECRKKRSVVRVSHKVSCP